MQNMQSSSCFIWDQEIQGLKMAGFKIPTKHQFKLPHNTR